MKHLYFTSISSLVTRATALLLGTALGSAALAQSLNTSPLGDVLAQGNTLLLSTAGPGEALLSATPALWIDELELGLAVTPGLLGTDAYEGSAIKADFNLTSPWRLQFNWSLSSDQAASTPGLDDLAFVLIDGQRFDLGSWQAQGQFSHTFLQGGAHTISVGLVDVGDVAGLSLLQLTGLQVTPVPEPQTAALMALGLVGLAAWRRRQRG